MVVVEPTQFYSGIYDPKGWDPLEYFRTTRRCFPHWNCDAGSIRSLEGGRPKSCCRLGLFICLFYVLVYVCTHELRGAICAHVCACIWRSEDNLSLAVVPPSLRQALSSALDSSIRLGWLVSEPQGSPCLYCPGLCWQARAWTVSFFDIASGVQLQSSWLHDKHITNSAISPTLDLQDILEESDDQGIFSTG